MPQEKPDDYGWFSITEAAEIFGLTVMGFRTSILPLVQEEDRRKPKPNVVLLRARGVIEAYAAKLAARSTERPTTDDDAVMMAGGNSPALERFRAAKAELTEMEVARQRRTHVNTRDFHDLLMRFASLVRKGGEILQRRFGPDAADIHNRAVDEAVELIGREGPQQSDIRSDGDAGAGVPSKASANNPGVR